MSIGTTGGMDVKATFDVIVVGAGFGGATCAALLARRGLRILLLEKNVKAGGKAMVVEKNGFTYELWPVIHAPAQGSGCIAVARELGLEETAGFVMPERIRGAIYIDAGGHARRFPDDADADPAKVFDVIGVPPGERERAMQVLAELTLMPAAEIDLLDDATFAAWLASKTLPRAICAYLHALANGIFMVPSDQLCASEAIRTLQAVLLRGGGLYCKTGGIGRLAELFAASVKTNGGRVQYGARVRQIVVEDGRVVGVTTGEGRFAAPIVVSNVGLQQTVLKLVGEMHFDRGYVNYVKDLAPSWGMMGVRYFVRGRPLDEPFYLVYSDESYWTTDRWLRADAGSPPPEVIMWVQVPCASDGGLAPPGRQCVLTGVWCSPDPKTPEVKKQVWWSTIDRMMERVWPGFLERVEARETYDTHDVSALSRDQVLIGSGGECIGLGQVVGQCGRHKPAARAPVAGLFYVGADAGGHGCGTHQAVDSGIHVSDLVLRYHMLHKAVFGTAARPEVA